MVVATKRAIPASGRPASEHSQTPAWFARSRSSSLVPRFTRDTLPARRREVLSRPSPRRGNAWALKWAFSLFLLFQFHSTYSPLAHASVKQEVYVTGHVRSFGGYIFDDPVTFEIREPGEQEIGRIVVDGIYNGEYPWIMRVYTDNLHFSGIAGSLRKPDPAGLVSADGAYAVPLFIQSPNFGPNDWRRIPDLSESEGLAYEPDPEPGKADYTDVVIMGIDPRNATWVAGRDTLLYTSDDNPLGDTTIATPFEMILKGTFSSASVRGRYEATLYLEIVAAP